MPQHLLDAGAFEHRQSPPAPAAATTGEDVEVETALQQRRLVQPRCALLPPHLRSANWGLNNSNGGLALTIIDTTIRPEPVPFGGTNAALTDHATNGCAPNCSVTMNRVDVANSGGMCLCGENTTIENSWLHDNYIAHLAAPSEAHTGGVFPYGGSGPVTIRNNRLEPGCNAGTGQPVNNYWQAITAVLFAQGEGGSVLRNYVAEGNFISLGAYDVGVENGQGLVFRNNVFGPNHWGETTTCSTSCGVTYADGSGNVKGDINGVKTSVVVPHPSTSSRVRVRSRDWPLRACVRASRMMSAASASVKCAGGALVRVSAMPGEANPRRG